MILIILLSIINTYICYEQPLSSFFDCIDTIQQCSTQSMLTESHNVAIEDHNNNITSSNSIDNNSNSSKDTGDNNISKDVKKLNQNLSTIIQSVDDLQYSNNFMVSILYCIYHIIDFQICFKVIVYIYKLLYLYSI